MLKTSVTIILPLHPVLTIYLIMVAGHMISAGPKFELPYCSLNQAVPLLCTTSPSCGWALPSLNGRTFVIPPYFPLDGMK